MKNCHGRKFYWYISNKQAKITNTNYWGQYYHTDNESIKISINKSCKAKRSRNGQGTSIAKNKVDVSNDENHSRLPKKITAATIKNAANNIYKITTLIIATAIAIIQFIITILIRKP